MTTDTDLRDVLTTAADGPARSPAGWDDIVRRGRRHARVARAQRLTAGGLLVAVLLLALSGGPFGTDDRRDVVATEPDGSTVPTAVTSTTHPDGLDPALPDLRSARSNGAFVTLIINPADPAVGFDPCTDGSAVVTETATTVTVRVQRHYETPGRQIWWAACQASPFSGWATIELAAPLGGRRLIDAMDGLEIPVIDSANLLFPTVLPEPFDITHWDEFGGETGLVDRTFSWSADDLHVSVRTAPLEGSDPIPLGSNPGDGCSGEPVTVRGFDGALCRAEGGGFVLLWDEEGYRRQIELGPVSDNPSPFTLDDLFAIADGLEPLG